MKDKLQLHQFYYSYNFLYCIFQAIFGSLCFLRGRLYSVKKRLLLQSRRNLFYMRKERCLRCLMWVPTSLCHTVLSGNKNGKSEIQQLPPKKLERQERRNPDHYQMQFWVWQEIPSFESKSYLHCVQQQNSNIKTDLEGTLSEPCFIACDNESSSLNQFSCISV